jgi:hypothetical protein
MRLSLSEVALALSWIFVGGCSSEQTAACHELLAQRLGQEASSASATHRAFYSKTLETCVMVEESLVGIDFVVDDISDSFLQGSYLFHCDRSGVDAAIIDSVRAYQGNVLSVKYSSWLDDGAGNVPRTMKASAVPYTGDKCRAALTKFLATIR